MNLNSMDDESDDLITRSAAIKFRAEIKLPFAYYFSYDPTAMKNHACPVSYDYNYDFTDEGDPSFRHHSIGDPGQKIEPVYLKAETRLELEASMNIRMFESRRMIFGGNSFELSAFSAVTPVSIYTGSELTITPLAFLSLSAGIQIGSGWNIPGLGFGLARNNLDGLIPGEKKEVLEKDSFYGAVFKNWYSMKLQFDLSAVMRKEHGRWTHVLAVIKPAFELTQLLNHSYYDRTYYWELRNTFNGWAFSCDFVLGYKFIIKEDPAKEEAETKMFMGPVNHKSISLTAVMWASLDFDLTHFNDSPMKEKGWGSDFVNVRFGPNFVIDLPYNLSVLLGFHWQNAPIYTDESVGNADFKKNKYSDWAICFDRIALSLSWNF